MTLIAPTWHLDDARIITGPTGTVHVTRMEAVVLTELTKKVGTMVSIERLMDVMWRDRDDGQSSNMLRVVIHHIREKLAFVGVPSAIRSIYGEGYVLVSTTPPARVLTLSESQWATLGRVLRIAERESPGIRDELGVGN